jgi:acetoin utilization protein AcuB
MLREIVTAPRNTTLLEAQALMRSARLRHLVVAEDGLVVGLLSYRTLLEASLALLRDQVGPDSGNALGEKTIETLVRGTPLTIAPQRSLEAAASQMLALRLGCLPVATPSSEGPRLKGLITEGLLLRVAYLPPPP